MPIPGQTIQLSEETETRLAGALVEQIDDLEKDHAKHFENLEIWREWYEAKPAQKVRSVPWEGASNLVVPLIRVAADATSARFQTRMFTPTKVLMGKTMNEAFQDAMPAFNEHMNWVARRQLEVEETSGDVIDDVVQLGCGVYGLAWRDQYQYRFAPGRKSAGGVPKYVKVLVRRGPVLEHIPREYVLWQKDRTIAESEIFVRQSPQTWTDLLYHAAFDGWSEEEIQECRNHAGIEGAQGRILTSRRDAEGVVQAGTEDLHDIREVWVELSRAKLSARGPSMMDPADLSFDDEMPIPIVVTLHKRKKCIVRAIAHPYFFGHWPFYDWYFRKRSGRGSGAGLCKILEHMQRGVTTTVNQALDAVTFANSITFVTTDSRFNNWKFTPGKPIVARTKDDVHFPNLPKQIMPDIAIANMLTAIAERASGVNDPNLGREVRMGGHPSPATSTLALLQEGNVLFNKTLKGGRKVMARIFEDTATLIQQFDTDEDGYLESVHGKADAEGIKRILLPPEMPVAGNMTFELYALSEYLNPDTEIQRAVLVDQLTSNYYAYLQQAMMILESQDPRITPGVKAVVAKAVEARTSTMRRILENNEIDDIERYLMETKNGRSADALALADIGKLVEARLGAGAPAAPGAGVGGPGAVGGGAPLGAPQPGMGAPPFVLPQAPNEPGGAVGSGL